MNLLYHAPFLKYIYPNALWQKPGSGKDIYLTFDDGPHPDITPWVLEQLALYQAKATFFCIGDNVLKHPETMRQTIEAGHRVGNHTFRHLNGFNTPTEIYMRDVQRCSEVLPEMLFRPPYGRMRRGQYIGLLNAGYTIVMWSLLSRDYITNLNTKKAWRMLKKYTQPGTIVVFHDSAKAEKNIKTLLPDYLQFLSEQHYNMRAL